MGRVVGILAAALLAVDLLHVRDSHWVTTDVPLAFLVALATLYALRYWRSGRRVDAGAAGLVAGLATSMKYPGGLAFLGLVVAHARGARPGRPGGASWAGTRSRPPASRAVGFVLGTPFALLTPVAFVRGVLDELREVHTVQFGNEADVPGYLFHLAYSLPEAMGWPLYLLALAGLVWALARRGARETILLAFAVPYLLVIVTLELPLRALRRSRCCRVSRSWRRGAWCGAWAGSRSGRGSSRGRGPPSRWRASRRCSSRRRWHGSPQYHRLLAQPDTRELGSELGRAPGAARGADRARALSA